MCDTADQTQAPCATAPPCDIDYVSPRTTYVTGTDYSPPAQTNKRIAKFDIRQVMEAMGWTDGTFIPVATEENQKLMLEMQRMHEYKEVAAVKHAALKQRVIVMQEHEQHTLEDIAQHQKLQDAHRSQMSDEHHLFKVARYHDAALTKRLRQVLHDKAELQKHDEFTLCQIEHINTSIAQHSGQMQWSRDALAEFDAAMRHGDDTNELIARYCKQDEYQAQHLEKRRQHLQAEIKRMGAELISTNNDQVSCEKVLDRTAQLYRQAHLERRQLVDTWKEAVQSLRQRERDIADCQRQMAELRASGARKSAKLREEEELLLQLQLNNREAEAELDLQNVRLAHTRERLTALQRDLQILNTDAITVSKLMQSVKQRLQLLRHQNREAQRYLTGQIAARERVVAANSLLRDKHARFVEQNLNSVQRLKQLEQMVDEEEKNFILLAAEVERLGGNLFRAQQMTTNWRSEKKLIDLECTGLAHEIDLEKKTHKQLEEELNNQTFIVYQIEYKTNIFTMRLNKMQGATSLMNPDLEDKIIFLTAQLNEKQRHYDMVRKQVACIEEEMRRLTARQQEANAEMERLQVKLEKARLEVDGGLKDLQRTTVENHELLVEQSMLKLRVHQMDEAMKRQRDKVFNLQRHQNDLQLAMNERLCEIKVRREQQQQLLKHLNEELTQLRADVVERTVKIATVRARFDNVVARLGRNEDGSTVSAAQIRVEMAQERQLLLKEGNELNARVLQAERDIKAIEHTLLMVNYANDAYRKLLEPVKEDNKESIALTETTAAFAAVQSELKFAQQQLAERCKLRQLAEEQQLHCEQTLEEINRRRMQNNETLVRLHRELLDQQPKLDRAKRELKLARRTAQAKIVGPEAPGLFDSVERQLRARELADGNGSALQQLADMVEVFVAMATVVAQQLWQRGLTMPMRTASFQRLCKEDSRSELSAAGLGLLGSVSSCTSSSRSARSLLSLGNLASCEMTPMGSTHAQSPTTSTARNAATGPAIVTLDFTGAADQPSTSRTSLNPGGGTTRRPK